MDSAKFSKDVLDYLITPIKKRHRTVPFLLVEACVQSQLLNLSKKKVNIVVSDADKIVLESCLDIACHSATLWAGHHCNAKQAIHSRAMGFLALYPE